MYIYIYIYIYTHVKQSHTNKAPTICNTRKTNKFPRGRGGHAPGRLRSRRRRGRQEMNHLYITLLIPIIFN